MKKPLVISILAKSCAHILPLYLKSITSQTEIDRNTIFYIRTNDNRDDTANILRDWYTKWNWRWKMFFDESSIDTNLIHRANHDWDAVRCKSLAAIRQSSIDFAIEEKADYWVQDCDNITLPYTIEKTRMLNLPAVAPFLRLASMGSTYSNYHGVITDTGYFQEDPINHDIWHQRRKGILEVPLIHCTYLLRNEILPRVKYDDGSWRYEYVMFADNLRKEGIPQYLDNREVYGSLFFSSNTEDYEKESNDYTKNLLSIYN